MTKETREIGLAVETMEDEIKELRSKYGDTPTAQQRATLSEMENALMQLNKKFAAADNAEWAKIRGELTSGPGAPIRGMGEPARVFGTQDNRGINPLRTPGVEARANYGYDEYGFDEYQRNRYGRLMNFNDNAAGHHTAELFGAMAIVTSGFIDSGSPLMRQARSVLKDRHGIEDPGSYRQLEYERMQRRDLSEAVSGAGGILVPTILESAIIILREQYGVFERNAQPVPMVSNQVKWPRRHQGIDAFWETEQAPLNFDTKMKFSQVQLDAILLTAIIAFSNQLDQDSIIPLGDYIAGEMAYKFAYKIDQAAFLGDGTGTYGNVMGLKQQFLANIPGTSTANPGLYTGSTSGEAANWTLITIDDITAFMGTMSVFSPQTTNWKFFCSWAFYNAVLNRLQSKAGGNTNITLLNGAASSVTTTQGFLGHEVEICQIMPRTIKGGSQDVVAYFGDMSMAAMHGTRRTTEITSSREAGQAYINNQTYMRALYRGVPNLHDTGLTTVDPAGNNIPGPIVAYYTHA